MESKDIKEFLDKELGINNIPVESTRVEFIGYDEKKKELWITFKGRKLYKYPDISKEVFEDLTQAPSKGRWITTNLVKTKSKFTKYVF
jgi:hypothetical protein